MKNNLRITAPKSSIKNQHLKALQFMLISVFAFTIMNTLIKYLQHLPAFELVFFRSISSSIICFFLLTKQGIPVLGNQRKLLITRGLVGVTAMFLFFAVIKLIPFGSAVSLRYISPIFAGILAIFILKERITPLQWGCFFLAFIGVLLIKGFDTRVSFLGLGLIILSAFFSGMVYIIIRKIGQRDHPLVVVNYFMFTATCVGGLFTIFNWQSPVGIEWVILLSMGIFGFFGQLFMTKAYQIASIGTVAPMKYLEAAFALLVGWFWFGEGYTILGLVGIGLIIFGMLLNIYVKK